MCDKEYVHHVVQKYRLAVAVSVIKSKPAHLSLDEYVELLRHKITETFNGPDDVISVTSDDFDLGLEVDLNTDSQKTLALTLENEDIVDSAKESEHNKFAPINLEPVHTNDLDTQACEVIELDTQDVFDKNVPVNTKPKIQSAEDEGLNESINILKDFVTPVVNNIEVSENSQALTDILTILKSVDGELTDLRSKHKPPENYAPKSTFNKNKNSNNPSDTAFDSQKTILYPYPNSDYAHVSQSQTENVIIEKQYLISKDKLKNYNMNQNLGDNIPCNGAGRYRRKLDEEFCQNSEEIDGFKDNAKKMHVDENNEDDLIDDDPELQQTERIPFKILEEMTSVKNLLNKRYRKTSTDGHSMDSGYRSDSQKSFRSSLQTSDNWLNQSGSSLLRHLAQSPLADSTQEINEEIAQVLGKLIDRLQDEEKCPTFLEDILENVDSLLKRIHEGSNGDETVLTEKDENMHRLLLFNKSIHVQKYTISKITTILENEHEKFTSTQVIPELENVDQIENLSYIFHILEILIQKHVKTKPVSQNSPCSQNEEKFPKRSTISEIWRKKWNSVSKDVSEIEGSSEKVCVLTKCREILNKIIVDCMNGYSLVAFSALQCFNLLQK